MAKNKTLEVYPIGSNATIAKDIDAKITAIRIQEGDFVEYLCAWWNGRTRSEDWFSAGEVTCGVHTHKKIGYRETDTCEDSSS